MTRMHNWHSSGPGQPLLSLVDTGARAVPFQVYFNAAPSSAFRVRVAVTSGWGRWATTGISATACSATQAAADGRRGPSAPPPAHRPPRSNAAPPSRLKAMTNTASPPPLPSCSPPPPGPTAPGSPAGRDMMSRGSAGPARRGPQRQRRRRRGRRGSGRSRSDCRGGGWRARRTPWRPYP